MQNNLYRDQRLPLAKKMIQSIIPKTLLPMSSVLITENNELVIMVLDTTFYTLQLDNFPPLPPIAFNYDGVESLEEDQCEINKTVLIYMTELYRNYMNHIGQSNMVANDPDLRSNPDFEMLTTLKSADGAKLFKIPGLKLGTFYHVPIFSGFPVLNKTDKIGISVYDLYDGHLFIEMDILKKKINKTYKMFFRVLNLSR